MTKKTAPYCGIMDALKALRHKGVRLAVVSNKFDAAVKYLCSIYFDGSLDAAVGESENVRKKPAPDSLLAAMDELGSGVGYSVYIGDSDVDVQTAHNAGLPCVGVTWGFRDREYLDGAEYIADSPEEMLCHIVEALDIK